MEMYIFFPDILIFLFQLMKCFHLIFVLAFVNANNSVPWFPSLSLWLKNKDIGRIWFGEKYVKKMLLAKRQS